MKLLSMHTCIMRNSCKAWNGLEGRRESELWEDVGPLIFPISSNPSWPPTITPIGPFREFKFPTPSIKKKFSFIFSCAGSLLLHGLFSSCREQGLLSSSGVQASHCSGLSYCRGWALELAVFSSCSSQALQHRLNSCRSWA